MANRFFVAVREEGDGGQIRGKIPGPMVAALGVKSGGGIEFIVKNGKVTGAETYTPKEAASMRRQPAAAVKSKAKAKASAVPAKKTKKAKASVAPTAKKAKRKTKVVYESPVPAKKTKKGKKPFKLRK